jgi:hypothetical protein
LGGYKPFQAIPLGNNHKTRSSVMNSKILVASQEDYVKFKNFLRFFVRQANENARNGRAERPTKNRGENLDSDNPEFISQYGLDPRFSKMAGLDFIIRFFMCGQYNTERSTYINIGLFDIIAQFDNGKKIIALRNKIRLEIPSLAITGEAAKRCDERNRALKFRSIETLGINNDNDEEPNDALKKMFDEYLSIHNELYEFIKPFIVKK